MKRGWLSGKVDKWSCGSAVAYPVIADWHEEEGKPLRATGDCINCGAPDDGTDECSYCKPNRMATRRNDQKQEFKV